MKNNHSQGKKDRNFRMGNLSGVTTIGKGRKLHPNKLTNGANHLDIDTLTNPVLDIVSRIDGCRLY